MDTSVGGGDNEHTQARVQIGELYASVIRPLRHRGHKMAQLDATINQTQDVQDLPSLQMQQVAVEALTGLSDQAKQQVAEAAGIPAPSSAATDRLWFIVIVVVAAVLALAALSLALGWGDNKTMLTVFTTTIGALVGLFVPSPVQKKT
jgi:hypothetical protein